jgi:hypothetical protein
MVLMGKELVVLLPGTPWHILVVVGARPLLPESMSIGLRRVVPQLMMLMLMLLLLLWDLWLPRLARVEPLVLVMVLVGTNMCMVVGPLVVLMQLLVVAPARLLPHGLLDREP